MRQPIRWSMAWTVKLEDPAFGAWVSWDDYAALKSEVERLRKAGDDMAHELHSCEPEEQIMLIAAWNAAKEGRDAK